MFISFSVIRRVNIRAMPLDMHRARFQRVDEDTGTPEVLHRNLHYPYSIARHHGGCLPGLRVGSYGKRFTPLWRK